MKNKSLLGHVRVASPCNARWEDMNGDDRARFCQHCQKHVFNLSAMSRDEAEALVREKEGKFCGRFHQRRDGRMLTSDCFVGRRQRRSRWLKASLALLVMIGALSAALATPGSRRGNRQPGPFAQKIDGWIYDVKVKLGIIQPPMIMGAIAIPLPPPAPPTPPANPNNPKK